LERGREAKTGGGVKRHSGKGGGQPFERERREIGRSNVAKILVLDFKTDDQDLEREVGGGGKKEGRKGLT